MFTEIVGYAAAFVGTLIMIPQTYKSYKTKRVNDISMSTLLVYVTNCILWETYGWLILSNPIIFCNAIGLCVGMMQITFKLKYGSSE